MKKIFNSLFFATITIIFSEITSSAQNTFPSSGAAGIGTTAPNASSLLEVKSTTKGVLFPRMTESQKNAIASPVEGLLIYQTDHNSGFYYYNGTTWKAVTIKKGWALNGNGGTDPSTDFIGTTDAQPLVIKVNNQKAGYIEYSSDGNTGFGYQTLNSNTGLQNTANGYQSLSSNTSGNYNSAFGRSALYSNTSASYNTANGFDALYSSTGGYNTATGAVTLASNTTGSQNTANGYTALFYNTTGSFNVADGYQALFDNLYGSNNTAIGAYSGPVFINNSNATSLGYNTFTSADNQVRLGNNSVTSIGGFVNWSNVSDGRVKKNIKQNVQGLTFINKLQPVTYNLDLDAMDKIVQRPALKDKDGNLIQPSQEESKARNQKEQIVYTGFVAQDVEKAAKEIGYDFSGVDAAKNDKDLYGLRYAEFVVPLVKAVQELSVKNDSKDSIIASQESQLAMMQKQNDDLQSRVAKLEAMMDQLTSGNSLLLNENKNSQSLSSSATLQQNIPNPFDHSTTIPFSIPQHCATASIIITESSSGQVLKTVPVSCSDSQVKIDASEFSSGNYSYSLIVDGNVTDTKRMIISK